jgi:DNA-binding CsgD family transcriptional regulator
VQQRENLTAVDLTSVEFDIIRGLANGLQSKELAVVINRSVPTVEMNIRRLYAKMSAKSRAHLVALAFSGHILTHNEVA